MRQYKGGGSRTFFGETMIPSEVLWIYYPIPKCKLQHVINYSKDVVVGQLITWLANKEHQNKILAESNNLTTVEQKFHRLISLETIVTSTPHLRSSLSSHLTFSSLRLEQKRFQGEYTLRIPWNRPCGRCRKTLHPYRLKGQKNCPARTHQCHNCGLIGHLEKVCWKPKMVPTAESAGSLTGHQSKILCNRKKENQVSYEQRWRLLPIPHLMWSKGRFQRTPPPTITISENWGIFDARIPC